jgi:hypothetical protein
MNIKKLKKRWGVLCFVCPLFILPKIDNDPLFWLVSIVLIIGAISLIVLDYRQHDA